MVFIEVAEVDAPEYEQQKLKKSPKSTSSITPEAASHKSGSLPVEENDTSVPVSSGGTEMPAKEALQQAKSKQSGNLHAEGEGDGWDTASEGDEVVGEAKNASSSNEKAATTSGSTEDHFEDALTEEELRAKAISSANAAKSQGNNLYAAGKYSEALECYASALEGVANDPSANELRAQCYSNRAVCEINLNNYSAAVKESTKALELNPNYLKALTRRAQANENLEKFEEALSDLKKALELDPSNNVVRASIIRLEPIVAKKREELKDEMIAKLKDFGNNILGKIGMSVDDFKAVKDPNTGSYSISFGKS